MSLADAFAKTANGQKLIIDVKRRYLMSAIDRNLGGRTAVIRNQLAISKISSLEQAEQAIRLVSRAKKSREGYYQAVDYLKEVANA